MHLLLDQNQHPLMIQEIGIVMDLLPLVNIVMIDDLLRR